MGCTKHNTATPTIIILEAMPSSTFVNDDDDDYTPAAFALCQIGIPQSTIAILRTPHNFPNFPTKFLRDFYSSVSLEIPQ